MVPGDCIGHDGPVDVDEGETVPHILLDLAAVVLLSIVGSAQTDVLPVLPSPGDGGLRSSCGVTVEGDGPAFSGQSVPTAGLVDDVRRDWKWSQLELNV